MVGAEPLQQHGDPLAVDLSQGQSLQFAESSGVPFQGGTAPAGAEIGSDYVLALGKNSVLHSLHEQVNAVVENVPAGREPSGYIHANCGV